MEATLEGGVAVRVRDVEIALVLAREMRAAADREVDASLRLPQLQEVFGAESLDSGERARIQTALEMAGLDPRPSLLEAEADEPMRFALAGKEPAPAAEPPAAPEAAPPPPPSAPAASAAPPAAEPAEERQEFPTVGEFARNA